MHPSSHSNNYPSMTPKNGEYVGKTVERMRLTWTRESSKNSPSNVHQKKAEAITIDAQETWAIACLVDGKHFVGGGKEGKIRRWRIKDGQEVGAPMDAKSPVLNIAVSQDGKWVVSGARSGSVAAWNAESHKKVTEFKAHDSRVCVVDVSPDATKIATGSGDKTLCVWSLSTGQRLLGPLGITAGEKTRIESSLFFHGLNSPRYARIPFSGTYSKCRATTPKAFPF